MGATSSHVSHILQGVAAQDEMQQAFKELDKDHDGYLSFKELEHLSLVIFKLLKADPKLSEVPVPFTTNLTFARWDRYSVSFLGADLVTSEAARALQKLMGGHDEPISKAQFMAFDWPHIVTKLEQASTLAMQEAEAAAVRVAEQLQAQEQERRLQEAAVAEGDIRILLQGGGRENLEKTFQDLDLDKDGFLSSKVLLPHACYETF
jgi:Ca2+-binding EF-hand superfamily protein